MRRTTLLLAATTLFVLTSFGCGGVATDDGASTDESSVTDIASPGTDISQSEQGLDFNDCACLDPSQVRDCRSGTCYCYKWNGTYDRKICWVGQDHYYYYSCKHYVSYRC